ncbi:HGL048Wp [Eremothecium sinecaudum]|uniref:HGL048Wp n=1 Tax=Eremothecium sinecaudum TaxID=45286 RepID=A0A109V050_9SACH|nr:HGL048Wp [Eremothecium sinecaudum]AMD22292.1 HGL048Wp [Eremothecium sinecaudum]
MGDAGLVSLKSGINTYNLKQRIYSSTDCSIYTATDKNCNNCVVKMITSCSGRLNSRGVGQFEQKSFDSCLVDKFEFDGKTCFVYKKIEQEYTANDYFSYSVGSKNYEEKPRLTQSSGRASELLEKNGYESVGYHTLGGGVISRLPLPSCNRGTTRKEIDISREVNKQDDCVVSAEKEHIFGPVFNVAGDVTDVKDSKVANSGEVPTLGSVISPEAPRTSRCLATQLQSGPVYENDVILIHPFHIQDKGLSRLPRTPAPKIQQDTPDVDVSSSEYDSDEDSVSCGRNGERRRSVNSQDLRSSQNDDDDEDDDDEDEEDDEDDEDDEDEGGYENDLILDHSQPNFLSPCVFLNEFPHKRPREASFIPTHSTHAFGETSPCSTHSSKKSSIMSAVSDVSLPTGLVNMDITCCPAQPFSLQRNREGSLVFPPCSSK